VILPASYSNGFAPRDGSPRYPELWRGCVGAWNPGLGPSGLTLRDNSGFGNHGTLTNGPTWVASQGKYAMNFDHLDDVVVVSDKAIWDFSGRPFSVSCWCKSNLASDYMILVSKTTMGNFGWALGVYASKVFLQINTTYTEAGGTVSTNKWHHVVGVWNTTTLFIHLDGILTQSKAATTLTNEATALRIGDLGSSSIAPMNGDLDDVRIYNRALSPDEIRTLATRPGIAYEMAPRRRSSSAVAFNRRRRLLLGST